MSEPDCTDVCEVVISRLRELGFKTNDEQDHTDVLDALSKVMFLTKKGAKALLDYIEEIEKIAQAEKYWLESRENGEPVVAVLQDFVKEEP